MIRVDTRWSGSHGIGRYAREVLGRLRAPWSPLGLDGNPAGALDPVRRRHVGQAELIYSPGFNAGLTRSLQVVTIHDLIHLDVPGARRDAFRAYYGLVVKPAVRRSGVVLTVSETSRQRILEWLDDDLDVVNAGNGSSPAFEPVEGARSPSGRPYVLFVGNFRPHKNAGMAWRAVAELDGVDLVAVTSDLHAASDLTTRLALDGRAHVVSAVDDSRLAELYSGAIATVVPSTVEGFGLPAVESLACGTPVVFSSGCASVAEIVDGAGVAVDEVDDAGAWARAIEHLAVSPIVVDSSAARRTYSWDSVAQRVDGVLGRFSDVTRH
jgi:glycosyltransferase involved in cell wall biosynthesis